MNFKKVTSRQYLPQDTKNIVVLVDGNWDDFGLKTTFELFYFDEDGKVYDFGLIKIVKLGMTHGRVLLDQEFKRLLPEYCSLGQSQSYYETLQLLPSFVRRGILTGLNDIVANEALFTRVESDYAVKTSLFRIVSGTSLEKFRSILQDRVVRTAFSFNYQLPKPHESVLSFTANPESHPPTNIHILIGSNGVGKTRLLRDLATLMRNHQGSGAEHLGSLVFTRNPLDVSSDKFGFANLITMAFSAFDPFTAEGTDAALPFPFPPVGPGLRAIDIGLKKTGSTTALKNPQDLQKEFTDTALRCVESANKDNWLAAIKILESDSVLAGMQLSRIVEMSNKQASIYLDTAFQRASSGHRIVLFSLTKLVSSVSERSLVLLDEPETHLHPPLQSAFIRALSKLLAKRNGIAIMATHSPVMLQEVPRECVWLLYRNGDVISAERPDIETFAENVGVLTREVFRLEVTNSGYHTMLKKSAKHNPTYEQVMAAFSGKVGTEGRGLIRALTRGFPRDISG